MDLAGAPPATQARFRAARLAVFLCIAASYAAYVLLRSAFTFVAPALRPALGLSLAQVGAISSVFPFAYGGSRLLTGVAADGASPAATLAAGLFLAGASTAAMGAATTVPALVAAYAAAGVVQGVGAGACARLLTAWYPAAARGVWWAAWSTSANVGAFLAPLVCGFLAARGSGVGGVAGWRLALLAPGGGAMALAVLTAVVMRDSPAAAGWAVPWQLPAEAAAAAAAAAKPAPAAAAAGADKGVAAAAAAAAVAAVPSPPPSAARPRPAWQTTIRTVARNRSLRALSAAYFLVYFVRQGLKSWLPFALGEVKAFPPATVAVLLSSLELAGVAGSFTSGVASDAAAGRRVAVTLAYLAGLVGSLAALAAAPAGGFWANAAAAAAAGFCINGPQVLIGLVGAEATRGKGTATALGVLGVISYMGAAVAGWPLTVVIQRGGWGVFGGVIVAAVLAACAVLAPMWKMSEATSAAAAKEE